MKPAIGIGVGAGIAPQKIGSGPGEILGDDLIAYYDAVEQGGNPQLLTWSDDPFKWLATPDDREAGLPDPEGGNNAWSVTVNSGSNTSLQSLDVTGISSILETVIAFKRIAPDDDGRDVSVGWRIQSDPAWAPMGGAEKVSGPGIVTSSPNLVNVDDLSETEWTYVKFWVASPVDPAKNHRIYIYPGGSVTNTLDCTVAVYRPTVQFANHDGKLYKSEGTVPAIVTVLKDFSKNGYDQPCTTGPIYVADAGDGLPAWFWDGTAGTLSDGAATADYEMPGYKWGCASPDPSHNSTRRVESGVNGTGRWLHRITGAGVWQTWSQTGVTGTTDVRGTWSSSRAYYDGANSYISVNGVTETTGDAGTSTGVDGIRTGANQTGTAEWFHGYIRATLTATGPLTQDQIDAIDQLFDSYRRGMLPGSRTVAMYDATIQGGNPQLLVHSDDPTQPEWTKTSATITLNQPDPDGGNNAWIAGSGVSTMLQCPLHNPGTPVSVVVAIKGIDLGTSGKMATISVRNNTQSALMTATAEVLSGPGSVRTSGGSVFCEDGSTTEWTFYKFTTTGAAPGDDLEFRMWPVANGQAGSSLFYRPTAQVTPGDSKQYKSEGVVPAIVTQLDDQSGNGYHQPCTTGPIYVADAGDGLPAWYWDGATTLSDGVDITQLDPPGYKWLCCKTDPNASSAKTMGVEYGASNATEWYLRKSGVPDYRFFNGATTLVAGPDANAWVWAKAHFEQDGSAWLDGVQGSTGDFNDGLVTRLRTGSNSAGLEIFQGYIRATLTVVGPLTAGEIARWDSYFEQLKFGILPGSINPDVGLPPEEILKPDQMVAYYDATREGAFDAKIVPQLLLHSDDGSNAVWARAATQVEIGLPDPDGGSNAWAMTADGSVTTDNFRQDFTVRPGPRLSISVKLKAGGPTTPDAECGLRFHIQGGASGNVDTLCEVVSGPGAFDLPNANIPKIRGLSQTEWTEVKLTMNVDDPGDGTLRFLVYPGTNDAAVVARNIFYRPTAQIAPHDGNLYPSGAEVAAAIEQWNDLSENKYDAVQADGAKQPLLNVESDGRYSVVFDGVDDALISASDLISMPGYIFAAFVSSEATGQYLVDGSGNRWQFRIGSGDNIVLSAGATLTGTPSQLTRDQWHYADGFFNGTKSEIAFDGAPDVLGDAGANSLASVRLGISSSNTTPLLGAIRCALIVQGPLAQVQIDGLRNYLRSLIP